MPKPWCFDNLQGDVETSGPQVTWSCLFDGVALESILQRASMCAEPGISLQEFVLIRHGPWVLWLKATREASSNIF